MPNNMVKNCAEEFTALHVTDCPIYYVNTFNPLTAGAAYICVFICDLLAHQVPPFKHVKDKNAISISNIF